MLSKCWNSWISLIWWSKLEKKLRIISKRLIFGQTYMAMSKVMDTQLTYQNSNFSISSFQNLKKTLWGSSPPPAHFYIRLLISSISHHFFLLIASLPGNRHYFSHLLLGSLQSQWLPGDSRQNWWRGRWRTQPVQQSVVCGRLHSAARCRQHSQVCLWKDARWSILVFHTDFDFHLYC